MSKHKSETEKILEIKNIGFMGFKPLNEKPIKIQYFELLASKGIIVFILESQFGETYDYEIKYKELDAFLANFVVINKPTIAPAAKATASSSKAPSNIEDIRSILFDTLGKLQEGSMDIDRAKAVSSVSQSLLNTVKVEMDYQEKFGIKTGIKMIDEKGLLKM